MLICDEVRLTAWDLFIAVFIITDGAGEHGQENHHQRHADHQLDQ